MNMTDYPTLDWNTRVPLVVYEMSTIPEHLSSPPVFSGARVAQYLDFCVVSCMSMFVFFLLVIVLSVLWFTVSDYPFGIIKHFLK